MCERSGGSSCLSPALFLMSSVFTLQHRLRGRLCLLLHLLPPHPPHPTSALPPSPLSRTDFSRGADSSQIIKIKEDREKKRESLRQHRCAVFHPPLLCFIFFAALLPLTPFSATLSFFFFLARLVFFPPAETSPGKPSCEVL